MWVSAGRSVREMGSMRDEVMGLEGRRWDDWRGDQSLDSSPSVSGEKVIGCGSRELTAESCSFVSEEDRKIISS